MPFDPTAWIEKNKPSEDGRGIGIKMIVEMARHIQYVPALQMNNLIVTMSK